MSIDVLFSATHTVVRHSRRTVQRMLRQWTVFLGVLLVFIWAPAMALDAQEADHEIHQSLRNLTTQAVDAINHGAYDKLMPLLSDQIRYTPITQQTLRSKQEILDFYAKWFGPDKDIRSFALEVEPDDLTQLSEDKRWGLATGKAKETYVAMDGKTYTFSTRWSAVVMQDADKMWRIRSFHAGANILSNALLDGATKMQSRLGWISGIVGLLSGLLLSGIFFRILRRPV